MTLTIQTTGWTDREIERVRSAARHSERNAAIRARVAELRAAGLSLDAAVHAYVDETPDASLTPGSVRNIVRGRR